MKRDWTKIVTAISALVVAVSILYGVIVLHDSMSWEGALGKLTLGTKPAEPAPVEGTAGVARTGSNSTVWESECPLNYKAISGTCIARSSGVSLQNIGPNGRYWECAWLGPMPKADVQAVCVPQSN
jgi:hypothetical protein